MPIKKKSSCGHGRKPKFNEDDIQRRFDLNLKQAERKLASLEFCASAKPKFQGLTGWVFEQTIQSCISKELNALGIRRPKLEEQIKLGGKARVDLLINKHVAVEIKLAGLFDGSAATRYHKYSKCAEKMGYTYLYLTMQEGYGPYKKATKKAFGPRNAFFLDEGKGAWQKFIERIVKKLPMK